MPKITDYNQQSYCGQPLRGPTYVLELQLSGKRIPDGGLGHVFVQESIQVHKGVDAVDVVNECLRIRTGTKFHCIPMRFVEWYTIDIEQESVQKITKADAYGFPLETGKSR